MSIIDSVKNTAFSTAVKTVMDYLEKDPEKNIPKAMSMMDKVLPDGWYEGQRAAFRKAIAEKGNWYQLIMKAYQLDAGVRKTFFQNFIVNSALEGFEQANDGRRGQGVFEKVMRAMDLLRKNKLPFGISTCYTSANYADISSEAFFDMMIEMGAMFVWLFHYMPVGNEAVPELLPTPEQRKTVYERIRAFRNTKPIFSMDFQNDAEYVGGCIAGGRNYLHINAAGDVEPCVFIHYSNVNIHECSLLEALKSPIFMAYRDGQPFNRNMLRPCPMLENPQLLREMVKRTGAKSTDLQSPESVDHLCEKCEVYAKHWKPMADELWDASGKGE